MSVKKRGSKYHYRFSVDGKGYNGVCKNCTNLAQAEAYEKKIREEVTAMRKFKTVTALVDAYRYELSGGAPVALDEACELQLPCHATVRKFVIFFIKGLDFRQSRRYITPI